MPTYLLLTTLSPQGLQTLRATPERLLEVNREFDSAGARVVEQWALLGPYDMLSVVEAPDDEAVMRLSANMAARGSAQVETLPVVPVDDFIGMLQTR